MVEGGSHLYSVWLPSSMVLMVRERPAIDLQLTQSLMNSEWILLQPLVWFLAARSLFSITVGKMRIFMIHGISLFINCTKCGDMLVIKFSIDAVCLLDSHDRTVELRMFWILYIYMYFCLGGLVWDCALSLSHKLWHQVCVGWPDTVSYSNPHGKQNEK